MDNMRYEVIRILRDHPETRNDDNKLLKEFSKKHCKQEIDLLALGISFAQLKTLERERRYVQRLNVSLRANGKVQQKREELEVEYVRKFSI